MNSGLQFNNLSVSVNSKQILHTITLSLKPGTVHALMGPNGSGKSSLAYTAIGHPRYEVQQGTICLNGVDITALSPDKRAQQQLFVAFQYPQALPGINVFSFLKETHRAFTGQQLPLEQLRIQVLEHFDTVGLDRSFLDRSVNEGFSGGEKKRFEMVQLLLHKPAVAILDEIDSGLDVDALKSVAQALQKVRAENRSMCILLITHYQRILDYCTPDFVHILADGVIARSGTAALVHEIEAKGYDAYRTREL
ncbi:MAG: Vegetative protein 296 [Candidatus Dependentiae bacterium ADurb.Bin331]|nr:MAG: Vegetative protein 296 [Candidatus Dependentiae bacterium ADurb.Bin331]